MNRWSCTIHKDADGLDLSYVDLLLLPAPDCDCDAHFVRAAIVQTPSAVDWPYCVTPQDFWETVREVGRTAKVWEGRCPHVEG